MIGQEGDRNEQGNQSTHAGARRKKKRSFTVYSAGKGMRPPGRTFLRNEVRRPHWISATFRDSFSAVTECRWSGISFSRWASPRRRANCSDGWSAEMSQTYRRSRPRKTGKWGSRRVLADNPADVPHHKPDYCLNVGITWPGLVALQVKDRVPRSRSSPSERSLLAPRNVRSWWATPDQARRKTGSAASAREAITSW